jgi:elongation factor P
MQANDLRKGMIVIWNGDLCKVLEFHHHTPGNLRAMVQAKLRNLRTGNQFEHRFRSQDEVEQAWIDQHEMEYMYSDGHAHHFMNTENFEQIALDREVLRDAVSYLTSNARIMIEFHESTPMGVELPKTVDLRVTDTAPGLKSATVTNVLKPATTETGLVVPVPNFINTGDVIRVDTETGAYLSRAKSE